MPRRIITSNEGREVCAAQKPHVPHPGKSDHVVPVSPAAKKQQAKNLSQEVADLLKEHPPAAPAKVDGLVVPAHSPYATDPWLQALSDFHATGNMPTEALAAGQKKVAKGGAVEPLQNSGGMGSSKEPEPVLGTFSLRLKDNEFKDLSVPGEHWFIRVRRVSTSGQASKYTVLYNSPWGTWSKTYAVGCSLTFIVDVSDRKRRLVLT